MICWQTLLGTCIVIACALENCTAAITAVDKRGCAYSQDETPDTLAVWLACPEFYEIATKEQDDSCIFKDLEANYTELIYNFNPIFRWLSSLSVIQFIYLPRYKSRELNLLLSNSTSGSLHVVDIRSLAVQVD
jgi:hypothetical protein